MPTMREAEPRKKGDADKLLMSSKKSAPLTLLPNSGNESDNSSNLEQGCKTHLGSLVLLLG